MVLTVLCPVACLTWWQRPWWTAFRPPIPAAPAVASSPFWSVPSSCLGCSPPLAHCAFSLCVRAGLELRSGHWPADLLWRGRGLRIGITSTSYSWTKSSVSLRRVSCVLQNQQWISHTEVRATIPPGCGLRNITVAAGRRRFGFASIPAVRSRRSIAVFSCSLQCGVCGRSVCLFPADGDWLLQHRQQLPYHRYSLILFHWTQLILLALNGSLVVAAGTQVAFRSRSLAPTSVATVWIRQPFSNGPMSAAHPSDP